MEKLSNKIYDWAKVIGQLVLPALLTFTKEIFEALGKDGSVAIKIGSALIVLYNVFIVAWNKVYHENLEEEGKG